MTSLLAYGFDVLDDGFRGTADPAGPKAIRYRDAVEI